MMNEFQFLVSDYDEDKSEINSINSSLYKNEEFMFMTEGLEDAINAFIASSIMDGVTDDSWNAFMASLDTLGYDYYIQFYQDYFDGNFN